MRNIFPQIETRYREEKILRDKLGESGSDRHIPAQILFHTYVRVLREGKWYEVEVNQDYQLTPELKPEVLHQQILDYSTRFTAFAYLTQQLWRLQEPNGTSIKESSTELAEADRILIRTLLSNGSLIQSI